MVLVVGQTSGLHPAKLFLSTLCPHCNYSSERQTLTACCTHQSNEGQTCPPSSPRKTHTHLCAGTGCKSWCEESSATLILGYWQWVSVRVRVDWCRVVGCGASVTINRQKCSLTRAACCLTTLWLIQAVDDLSPLFPILCFVDPLCLYLSPSLPPLRLSPSSTSRLLVTLVVTLPATAFCHAVLTGQSLLPFLLAAPLTLSLSHSALFPPNRSPSINNLICPSRSAGQFSLVSNSLSSTSDLLCHCHSPVHVSLVTVRWAFYYPLSLLPPSLAPTQCC